VEEAAAEETHAPRAAAGGLSWVLDHEDDTTVLRVGSNGGTGGRVVVLTGEQRQWVESRSEGEQSGGVDMEEAKRERSTQPRAGIIGTRGGG
jgi:hypothetical protein